MTMTTAVVLARKSRAQAQGLANLTPIRAERARDAHEVDQLQVPDVDHVVGPRHGLEHSIARRDSRNDVEWNAPTLLIQFWFTHGFMLRR